jgi:hypothetical protein
VAGLRPGSGVAAGSTNGHFPDFAATAVAAFAFADATCYRYYSLPIMLNPSMMLAQARIVL